MKKGISLILAIILMLAIVSCQEVIPTQSTTETTEHDTTTITTIETTTEDPMPYFEGVEDKIVDIGLDVDFLEGITASDLQDGDLTADIQVESTGFDNQTEGEYTINVYVIDSDSNRADESYTITVIEDVYTASDWLHYDLNHIDMTLPLELPQWSNNGSFFYWSSNNPRVVTNNGYIIPPPLGSEPAEVILTCAGVNGVATESKSFHFTVQPNTERIVTSYVELPFYTSPKEPSPESEEYLKKVFFVDEGTIPYIDVETFINMSGGGIYTDWISIDAIEDDLLRISYTGMYLPYGETLPATQELWLELDFAENTATFNDARFQELYVVDQQYDEMPNMTAYTGHLSPATKVVIPFGDYDIDLVTYTDGDQTYYLMPLEILNLIFLAKSELDIYYNGDALYGLPYEFLYLEEYKVNEFRNSSLNDEEIEDDLRLYSYHFMAMALDYFYGLRDYKNIESGYDIMGAYIEAIMTNSDTNFYRTFSKMLYALDDGHTVPWLSGYYEEPFSLISSSYYGPHMLEYFTYRSGLQALFNEKYGETVPMASYIDNNTIAIFHFERFEKDTQDDFRDFLDNLPASIESVVVDIALNGGGWALTVFDLFGLMTDDVIPWHLMNPLDGSGMTYLVDSFNTAYDYDYFIFTSNVSYSASNLFALIGKEMGIPIFGMDTFGGSCIVDFLVIPGGAIGRISSNYVISYLLGNPEEYVYVNAEGGVEVDYLLSGISDEEIINAVHSLS